MVKIPARRSNLIYPRGSVPFHVNLRRASPLPVGRQVPFVVEATLHPSGNPAEAGLVAEAVHGRIATLGAFDCVGQQQETDVFALFTGVDYSTRKGYPYSIL